MTAKRFTVVLERVQKTATMFRVLSDLDEAFGRAEVASAFDRLSFTHRREYVEWVEEARRPETRARRIAGTVERVREGRAPR